MARPNRVVLTKLDEAESLAPLVGVLRELELPISYLGTGQRVPEDLERATAPGPERASARLERQRQETTWQPLSELIPPRTAGPVTIAVASGKGGVGKTSVVVNLAVALARLRQRVAILDADFGLGNVDVLLGLTPSSNVGHVLVGDKKMKDIVVKGPLGVQVIPASSGLRELTVADGEPVAAAGARAGGRSASDLDFLLIDTAAGISDNVVDLLVAASAFCW